MGKAGVARIIGCFALVLFTCFILLPAVPASAAQLAGSSADSLVVSQATDKISVRELSVSTIRTKYYNGRPQTPKPVVKYGSRILEEGSDYVLKYKNNVLKGTASVIITGYGDFTGSRTVYFRIAPRTSISGVRVAVSKQGYTGKALTPMPKVTFKGKTLVAGTDFKVRYKNNVRKGTATVIVIGKGRYSGRAEGHFKIVTRTRLSKTIISAIGNKTFTGKAIAPKPRIVLGSTVLRRGIDYTLSYKSNVNVGTATVTIVGKGLYVGTRAITFRITRANIASATMSAIPKQMCTGNPITPKPKVVLGGKTLTEGREYTLSYKSNVSIGRATVTITGKGNLFGSVSLGFRIIAHDFTGIKVHEKASTGAVRLDMTLATFNEAFSYGDSLDIEFSNGFKCSGIPYYNGWYAKSGDYVVVAYSGVSDPLISTNYGDRMWDIAGLSEGDTVTIRLAERGAYSEIQDALDITYSDSREDFSSDEVFANFRQVTGGNLSGNLYRSSSPICNWRKRAAYASDLADRAGIAFVLNLSDSSESISTYIKDNNAKGVDTSYYESLFSAGNGSVFPLSMNNSYSTPQYQTKLAAGLSVMAHRDGPYLVHCLEGKDRTGFTCLLLEALAGASYDEMLADYMSTYANYCGITEDSTPKKYQAVQSICFDSMIGFLMSTTGEADYGSAARAYLVAGGMDSSDIDLLVEKLTS